MPLPAQPANAALGLLLGALLRSAIPYRAYGSCREPPSGADTSIACRLEQSDAWLSACVLGLAFAVLFVLGRYVSRSRHRK